MTDPLAVLMIIAGLWVLYMVVITGVYSLKRRLRN